MSVLGGHQYQKVTKLWTFSVAHSVTIGGSSRFWPGQTSILKRHIPDIAPLPGVHVSTIATKTGTYGSAESNARVVVEICDSQGTCCQTSSDGLDNPGQDRENGQTDVYTSTTILGNCAQEVIHILTLGQ